MTLSQATAGYSNPLTSTRLLLTMLNAFGQGPALLRELGVSLPLDDSQLEGVNACGHLSWGVVDYWVRLVQVTDSNRQFFLYIGSATPAETQSALDQTDPSGPASAYAYPPLGQDTYAGFAPPLPAIPDVTGVADGWITPIPSTIIRMTNPAWARPFLATITATRRDNDVPVPGYRRKSSLLPQEPVHSRPDRSW